ncbi:uncharacterized protein [Leptinotarsa decemlineata]|uniref:uncharacterized protein n=1 Tax=Leptinotarsa decemlineata TaxID=7539 RepID=UPI003D307E3A
MEKKSFLNYLNSFHTKIQFTKELKENLQIPFLDVFFVKEGNKLGHEERYVDDRIKHLTNVLQANGYDRKDIIRATRPKEKKRNTSEDQPQAQGTVYLPYIEGVTNRFGKILKKEKINNVFKPTKYLRSAKDSRDSFKSAGVYRIPCNCGSLYRPDKKKHWYPPS